jgi:hypothetical protein
MPSANTFTTLQSDLQAYLERGELTDTTVLNQLPRLINNAERRISRALKILGFQTPMVNTFTAGNPIMPKPDRWRETISFNYGNFNPSTGQYTVRTPMTARSYEYVRAYNPDDSVIGQPRYFADYDYTNWVIAPTPDQNYPFEVLYWQMPALLDSVNQQNWLTEYAPETLLYSSLLECAPFLKDDGRVATWQTFFDAGMKALSNENVQDLLTRSNQTHQSVGATP